MKQKPTWQKVILKILTYTLVAIIASASTFAVLGERSTALDELENIIQIKFGAQSDLKEAKQELANQKEALDISKQELEASKAELAASQKQLEASQKQLDDSQKHLEEVLAQLDETLNYTETLKELLLNTNQELQDLLQEAQLRESEMADQILQLQQALKDLEEKQQQKWIVPIKYEYVSSAFGYRDHPVDGEYKFHYGVDLAACQGTPIVASRSGTVTVATYQEGGAGYYVTIDHLDGYKSQYLHMSRYIVEPGQFVFAGQIIGYCGSTGASTGPHLDFRIMLNGNYVDPAKYIDIG